MASITSTSPRPQFLAPIPSAGGGGGGATGGVGGNGGGSLIEKISPKIATLSRKDTSEKRNSHFQNSCVEMLQHGYHRAYTELFNLVTERNRQRNEAGPGTTLYLETPIQQQTQNINKLKFHLCESEKHDRGKNYQEVYRHISSLAILFDEQKLDWLSQHFYNRSLEVATHVRLDSGKSLAEANEKCGLGAEKRNELEKAASYLEATRKISKGRSAWKHENGRTWHEQASLHYSRILLSYGKSIEIGASVEYLEKSVSAAAESKSELQCAIAGHYFGMTLFRIGQNSEKVLNNALENAIKINNTNLIQLVTEQLALVARKGGNMDAAIAQLKLACQKTKEKEDESCVDALSQVALLYNACGEYGVARESIEQAYLAAGHKSCESRELSTRVLSGTINGNNMLSSFRKVLSESTKNHDQLRKLVEWKDHDVNKFD